MQMLSNGNYEEVVLFIQHECHSNDFTCTQYSLDMENLKLVVTYRDPYEDGFEVSTKVNFCPFCGYKADKKI